MRKVCVVTGTRAEYGLLKLVCRKIKESASLQLQIIVTGSHLSKLHGETYHEIDADGFSIDRFLDINLTFDTAEGVSNSTALSIQGMSKYFNELNPDVVLLLGDRYELLGAALGALFHSIVVAHIHGGETTEGAFDESIRHCLTKLSHLHFVATNEYRKRVIQLGEKPERVFNVGGLGVDAIHNLSLLGKAELESDLGFKIIERNLLVTYHPETLARGNSVDYLRELLTALDTLEETLLIFTLPNADPGHVELFELINEFVSRDIDNRKLFASLGQLRYLSCLKYVDGVVGNSSSGLLEVPSFKKGTVNIGDRQKGRVRASSVIDCSSDRISIVNGLKKLYSPQFREAIAGVINPYGQGGAAESIVKVLETFEIETTRKEFHDLIF